MTAYSAGVLQHAVRRRFQARLRARVAGPDVELRERRIYRSDGERHFHPDDPIWWVHSDPAIFAGGIRALLVQSLHPLAMAGVAGHSGFQSDPWGRLQRTSNWIATTTYAPTADAERLAAAVRGIHDGVRGTTSDGHAYAASDPHLLGWVHAAEAESFLTAHQALGARRLTPSQADTYVAQIGSCSARVGLPDPRRTVAQLQGALTAYLPELRISPEAEQVRDFLLQQPPLPRAERPAYAVLAAAAVATLPPWAADLLDLQRSPRAACLAIESARAATRFMRWATEHPAHSGRWAHAARADAAQHAPT